MSEIVRHIQARVFGSVRRSSALSTGIEGGTPLKFKHKKRVDFGFLLEFSSKKRSTNPSRIGSPTVRVFLCTLRSESISSSLWILIDAWKEPVRGRSLKAQVDASGPPRSGKPCPLRSTYMKNDTIIIGPQMHGLWMDFTNPLPSCWFDLRHSPSACLSHSIPPVVFSKRPPIIARSRDFAPKIDLFQLSN